MKDKIPESDKAALETTIQDTIKWLDTNPFAEKEEYEEKQKALQDVAAPILQKMASGGTSGPAGSMPDMQDTPMNGTNDGPTIEELD